MREVVLTRRAQDSESTFGVWESDSTFSCFTAELPWRDNKPFVSCIPPGVYDVEWAESVAHGWCYHVRGIPGRKDVEIHAGNIPLKDSKGCILPGTGIGPMNGRQAVLYSRVALTRLESDLKNKGFQLTILGCASAILHGNS